MTNLNTLKPERLDESQKQLVSHVDSIIKEIESGKYEFESSEDFEEPCASHYLENALDINYLVDRDKNYKSGRILIAFGGPNIWIDTYTKEVQGHWGSDEYIRGYYLGLDDYLEEIYNCS